MLALERYKNDKSKRYKPINATIAPIINVIQIKIFWSIETTNAIITPATVSNTNAVVIIEPDWSYVPAICDNLSASLTIS